MTFTEIICAAVLIAVNRNALAAAATEVTGVCGL